MPAPRPTLETHKTDFGAMPAMVPCVVRKGLPRLIVVVLVIWVRLHHSGLLFLYIAGFIGWSAFYLRAVKKEQVPPRKQRSHYRCSFGAEVRGFRLALAVGAVQFLSGDLVPKTKKSPFPATLDDLFIDLF